MNWRCRWLWHHYDEIGADCYCVYYCTRCGHEQGNEPGILPRLAWRVRLWWHERVIEGARRRLEWFLPCRDCGRWFGRHDDSQDHIPF